MGFFDFLSKKEPEEIDPLKDLVLSKLHVGFFLDYDMKTWEVTAHNTYDYGDGYFSEEWELTSGNDIRYLERYEDDDVEWSFCQKIPIGKLENNIRQHIMEHEDPPEKIRYENSDYFLDDSGAAYYSKAGNGAREELIYWTYITEDEKNFITIEQWGESEFEASTGLYVEEYQFTNILPGNEN